MVLQSPSRAKIHLKLGTIIFDDVTFFICPSILYQVFTGVYSQYYTTSFSFMNKKRENNHTKIFNVIDENIIFKNNLLSEIHTDFELAIDI